MKADNKYILRTGLMGLYIIPAAVNLIGHWVGNLSLTRASKPFLMPLMALSVFLWMTGGGVRSRNLRLIVAALLSGALGDVLLMPDGSTWLLGGMVAFLAGHILYYSTLPSHWRNLSGLKTAWSWPLLLGLLGGTVFAAGRFPAEGIMKIAITIYACAFAFLMHGCIMAAVITKRFPYCVTAFGFLVFAISDALVAVGAFTDLHVEKRGFIVMLTYISAQILVSHSLSWIEIDKQKEQKKR